MGSIASHPSLFIFGLNPKIIPAIKCVINTEMFWSAWKAVGNYLTLPAVSDPQSVLCLSLASLGPFFLFLHYLDCPEMVELELEPIVWTKIVNSCTQWTFPVQTCDLDASNVKAWLILKMGKETLFQPDHGELYTPFLFEMAINCIWTVTGSFSLTWKRIILDIWRIEKIFRCMKCYLS